MKKRPKLPIAPGPRDGAGVAVSELLEGGADALKLDLAAGRAGLENRVHLARVQRPGLALTGYTDYIRYGRVQILGSSEAGYLRKLPARQRRSVLRKLCRCRISCFVVTMGIPPAPELLSAAAPRATLRLFKHRQGEFLLRPLMNASSNPEGWGELHEAYRYAQAAGFLRQPVTVPGTGDERSQGGTLENQYIRVLLLDVMNDGQFSPYDAFWLSRFMPRWCEAVSLRADAGDGGGADGDHFVVDLDSAEGLKRATAANPENALTLDPSPLLALIGAEIESLRDPPYRGSVHLRSAAPGRCDCCARSQRPTEPRRSI